MHCTVLQILQYVELNPLAWPESPDQPLQLLSTAQQTQLLQGAATAWQHYVQCKLAGQQPQPVTHFVPWRAVGLSAWEQADQPGCEHSGHMQQARAALAAAVVVAAPAADAAAIEASAPVIDQRGNVAAAVAAAGVAAAAAAAVAAAADEAGMPASLQLGTSAAAATTAADAEPGAPGVAVAASVCSMGAAAGPAGSQEPPADHADGSASQALAATATAAAAAAEAGPLPAATAAAAGAAATSTHSGSTGTHNSSRHTGSTASGSSTSSDSDTSSSSESDHTSSKDSAQKGSPQALPSASTSSSQAQQGRPLGCCSSSLSWPMHGMLLAYLARTPPSKYFDPKDPWSVYVEVKVQLYLQQLSGKIERWLQEGRGVRQPKRGETLVPVGLVSREHPLPWDIMRHYTTVNKFGRNRAELDWLEKGLGDRCESQWVWSVGLGYGLSWVSLRALGGGHGEQQPDKSEP